MEVYFLLSLLFVETVCQELRSFPALWNIAEEKSLTTVPTQSTCGIPDRSAYCKSSTFVESILECRQDYCVQECPSRTSLPASVDLLEASGYGACVLRDMVTKRPGSEASDASASFLSQGSQCYLSPLQAPNLGANGALSLTFWVWLQGGDSTGYVISCVLVVCCLVWTTTAVYVPGTLLKRLNWIRSSIGQTESRSKEFKQT